MINRSYVAVFVTTALVSSIAASPAFAQAAVNFNLPAQELSKSLKDVARATNTNVVFNPALIRGKQAPPLNGQFDAGTAIARLIAGQGLTEKGTGSGTFVISGSALQGNAGAATEAPSSLGEELAGGAAANSAEILVTGSRVRGAPPTSPVITITQDQMRQAGQSNLGDVVRSIPQNFGGGQNPGVIPAAGSPNSADQNITGGTGLDLRGIGPDATLTLLNGRRLSYDSFNQATDISAIPLAAVDRIEIVADGASAIYGSDAVAGVANVVLKQDYRGLTASAYLADSTDGGDFQQQYSLTTGSKWDDGGFIATAQYGHNTAVYARDRSAVSYLPDPYTLYPALRNYSGLISAHQDVGSVTTLKIEAMYSHRTDNEVYSFPRTDYINRRDTSFEISPVIDFHVTPRWELTIGGVYGQDHNTSYMSSLASTVNYANSIGSLEIGAEGPILALPGGDVRLAIGAGYRGIHFNQAIIPTGTLVNTSSSDRFGYGELFVPLASPTQDIPLLRLASISAAVRYERYDKFGSIATPKIGLIYSPVPSITLKGSWGKSFKVPTLLQQGGAQAAYLYPASILGGTGPADSAVLLAIGGNPNLKPERATTWTSTIAIDPPSISGLHAQLSYFHIRYGDRILQPIGSLAAALSNPLYSDFVVFNPTLAQQQAVIASSATGLVNYSGSTYDPGAVLADVYDYLTNVSKQVIHGFDGSAAYKFPFASGSMDISIQASWLKSREQILPGSPAFDLAGTVFNPPNFRSRGSISWSHAGMSMAAYVNYIGGLSDIRSVPHPRVGSMTTVDFSLRYDTGHAKGIFDNAELILFVQNAFDASPPYLRNTSVVAPDYDATNYSIVGRVVGITLSKSIYP